MRILFVGDIIGKPGRRALAELLDPVRRDQRVDFTIVNVENSAGGFGITSEIGREVLDLGADVLTSGNHIWDKRDVLRYIEEEPRLLRPLNYPPGTPGQGSIVAKSRAGIPVAVVNLQGRVFMTPIDCPFQAAQACIPPLREAARIVIVDFHAEATSEKVAFGWFLDGQVSAVLGTHTHVATADARVLPQGTAYVTDVGMTGPIHSVIGMKVAPSMDRFLTARRVRYEVAGGPTRFSSVVIEVDEESGRALSIERVDIESEGG